MNSNEHRLIRIIKLGLASDKYVRMPVYGDCMNPIIKSGDFATIKAATFDKLKCGDVVVFNVLDRIKIHRFLKHSEICRSKFIITKGDRCRFPDPMIPIEDLLGKVILVDNPSKQFNFERPMWMKINFVLGKASSFISKGEQYTKSVVRFIRKCASKLL
jgi:signal peptidase I